jgi:hypothetical protein
MIENRFDIINKLRKQGQKTLSAMHLVSCLEINICIKRRGTQQHDNLEMQTTGH